MAEDVYPVADLQPGANDLPLTPLQFLAIPRFSNLRKNPKDTSLQTRLKKCQGALVLRRFTADDPVICRQGAAGMSAYYILNEADVYGLYAYVERRIAEAQGSTKKIDKLQAYLKGLLAVRDAYRGKLPFLSDPQRTAVLKAAHEADAALARYGREAEDRGNQAKADLYRRLAVAGPRQKLDHAAAVEAEAPDLAAMLRASAAASDSRPAAAVSRGGARTPQTTLYERELFGEMACKNRKPRAATVSAVRDCYVVEMLGNVFDLLEQDPRFKQELEETYEQRILELHLRDLSLFRHLPEKDFAAVYEKVRSGLDVVTFDAGQTICREGDPADAVFLIRQGWVQVKAKTALNPEQVLSYRRPGDFIGEMGLIHTPEQVRALRAGDFGGVLSTMPPPGPRTATCVAFGHPDGTGRVELIRIPYEEFWQLIRASPGIQRELADEVERRMERSQAPPLLPMPVAGDNPLFSAPLVPLGLYQGQRLMLIDLDRCTRCDECVRACVATHDDGRSRLFLDGPRAAVAGRTHLVPSTCRSCIDPVCMIGCPTRAIRRGDKGEMIIKEEMCVGCEKCARQCPYGAIQMYDLGLIPARSRGWHYLRAADVPGGGQPWYQGKLRATAWRRGAAPFAFDRDFREGLGTAVSAEEPFYFWHTFELPEERDGSDGQLCLEVSSAPDGFKVWIDGQEIEPEGGKATAKKRTYRFAVQDTGPTGFLWWRKPQTHRVALQVIPRCAEGAEFLDVRLDVVRPPRGPWDILDDITEKARQPKLAVVCDLCRTLPAGPSCVRACPHNATLRFDARGGVPNW